jgi:hypothetical protein
MNHFCRLLLPLERSAQLKILRTIRPSFAGVPEPGTDEVRSAFTLEAPTRQKMDLLQKALTMSSTAAANKKRKPNSRGGANSGGNNNARGSKKAAASAPAPSPAAAAKGVETHKKSSSPPAAAIATGATTASDLPPSSGFLLKCDIPTKMFIQNLDDLKTVDKKFIIQNLDSYHLLVKHSAREEIERKVEEWMDEVRIMSIYDIVMMMLCDGHARSA